jgi:hypothetical protein
MKIWRAFLGELDQRQKTVKRVASREPSVRAQRRTLESGKLAGQRSTSSGDPGRSAGIIRRGRRCLLAGGGKPTRRQATHGEKSRRNAELRRSIVRFAGQLCVAPTCNPPPRQYLSCLQFRQPTPGWYRDAAEGSPMAELAGGELRIRRRCS